MRKILIVLLGVVIVVGAAFAFIQNRKNSEQKIKGPYQETGAKPGLVVEGFPKSLIIHPAGEIADSYKLEYSDEANQYTATFETSQTVAQEYNDYLKYVTNLKYEVSNQKVDSKSANLYARNADSDINVVITLADKAKHPMVTVTYVRK